MSVSLSKQEQWKYDVCTELVKNYENVILTPLSSTSKKIDAKKVGNIPRVVVYAPIAGRLKVKRLIVVDDGGEEVTTNFSIQAYKKVWAFKKRMHSGELIDKSDVYRKNVNVAPFIGIRNFEVQNPVGMTPTKAVSKGALLYEEIVSAPALIKARDKLTVLLHAGNLKIKTIGVALEDGKKLQDEIKVRIVETGAVVNGKITGKKDVYVEI